MIEDSEEETVVHLYDYYRAYGVSDTAAIQLVLHILLTRSYGSEADARIVAQEFNIHIPYVLPDTGQLH